MAKLGSYHLGCPVWACKGWAGSLFTRKVTTKEFLAQYSQVFNTVEGNTSFYASPTPEIVARWCEAPESFKFCFKLPRAVTHERRLVGVERDLAEFLELVSPLGSRLGPFFIQLPASFGVWRLKYLERFLAKLPAEFRFAVEVRHPDFFDDGPIERALVDVLRAHGAGRILMDSRPLFAARPSDPHTAAVQARKPRVPVRRTVTSQFPCVRFIGQNEPEANEPWLREWASVVEGWLNDGLQPFMFVHAPSELYAPQIARRFHSILRQRSPEIPPLPAWPGECEPTQLSLGF